jgi:hypothetical protein
MLNIERVRTLSLDPSTHPLGHAHFSAASGLVRVKRRLFVVADDEFHIAVLDDIEPDGAGTLAQGVEPVRLERMFEGTLPADPVRRKKAKPDVESLAALPPLPGCPFGALLALGSGSRPTRETGLLMALDAAGNLNGRMAQVSFSALYTVLKKRFVTLNIEGAFVLSGELRLLQRGLKGNPRSNACISYDWNTMAPWLAGTQTALPAPKAVQLMDLGEVDGVPLSLTDGAALDGGRWVFCAVAEDTRHAAQDGPCVASAVGVVGANGRVLALHRLQGHPKVEGIAARLDGNTAVLTLVTDADDPAVASVVLKVCMPLPDDAGAESP